MTIDLRALQQPLKTRYRETPDAAVIRSEARCTRADPGDPRTCSVLAGPLRLDVTAHPGVGGTGAEPCSGDLLVAALAACQQITTQMVAAAMGLELASCEVRVGGELDLAGTLGVRRQAGVGYRSLTCDVRVSAPSASPEQLERLADLARRYCVVHATLREPPRVEYRFE